MTFGTTFERFLGRGDRSVRLGLADLVVLFAVFGGLVLLYFVPPIMERGVLTSEGGDVALYWIWARQYLGDALREFRLPLWNPHIMSGTPFLASSQSAAFYPPNWLHAVLPVGALLNTQMIFHFWFGLAAMHLLLRRLGRSVTASAAGALVFGFSGFAILHWWAGHLPFVTEWPWTPLAVLAWAKIQGDSDGGTRRGVVAGCLGMSGALAMQFFSGHPQIVYYTLLIVGGLQLGWLIHAVGRGRAGIALRGCVALALALALSGTMIAIQAFPTLRHTVTTVRSPAAVDPALVRNYYESLSQPPWLFLATALMWPFGSERGAVVYFGGGASWEVVGFVGMTALLLALACFQSPRRSPPLAWTLLFMLVFAWWLALGHHGGLFRALFGVFPGLSMFRAPTRMIYIVTFCVAALAATGLDLLWRLACENPGGLRSAVRRIACLVVVPAIAYLVLFVRREHSPLALWVFRQRLVPSPETPLDEDVIREAFAAFQSSVLAGFCTAAVVLLLISLLGSSRASRTARRLLAGVLFAELIVFALPYREVFVHERQVWPENLESRLREIGPRYRIGSSRHGSDRNQSMVRGIRHVWGYEPTVSYRYGNALKIALTKHDGFPDAYLPVETVTPLTRALATRLFVDLPDTKRPTPPEWHLVARTLTWSLYEDPLALERGYTVPRAEVATPEAVRWMVNRADFQPTCTVLLEQTPPPGFSDSGETTAPGTVRLVRDENELVEAEVDMRGAGWFVLMDTLLPGWTALVDGRPAQVYRANAVGRALPLEAGRHVVRMEYRAPGLAAGARISAMAWTAWLAGALAVFATRRRRQGSRDPEA